MSSSITEKLIVYLSLSKLPSLTTKLTSYWPTESNNNSLVTFEFEDKVAELSLGFFSKNQIYVSSSLLISLLFSALKVTVEFSIKPLIEVKTALALGFMFPAKSVTESLKLFAMPSFTTKPS